MSKLALIDGDTIAYRCAASCEPTKLKQYREDFDTAIQRADELTYRILNSAETSEYRIFLGGTDNFRYRLYPQYKANRPEQRPEWLGGVREFLVREWNAEIVAGYEADDGIGIAANESSIICANDKDYKQIPGEHYNFVREEFLVIDEDQAQFYFWLSMLVGDSADNIRGVDGIGAVKGRRLLEGLSSEEMYQSVRRAYDDDERFLLNYRLLRILRSEEEYVDLISEIEGKKPPEDGEGRDSEEVSGAN